MVGAPWNSTPGAEREGDEVPAARYPIAEGGGEQPRPVQLAVRSSHGGVLGPRTVYIRAGEEIKKYGTTPGCQGRGEHSEESQHRAKRERERERLTTEMQHDEWLARRIQAAVDRNRPRANPEDERNAVRPRAMQQDDVQSNQTSAEVSGDRHRDQSGSGEMQVEDRAVQASAQGAKRLAEVVLQRDSGARHWSCNGPRAQRYRHEQHCDD